MPTLLQLDSSADATGSVSRAVTATFAETWTALGDDHTIIRRDLHADPLPHLADASLHWPSRLRRPGANPPAETEALQQQVIDELISVDAVVIGAPMYNYSVPSVLKVWLDHIHIPGVTTPFEDDSQPMAGKPAVITISRTLSDVVPGLADEAGRAAAELQAAHVTAADLACTIGAW